MNNHDFCIRALRLKPKISRKNSSVASVLEGFSLQLPGQSKVISDLSESDVLNFRGIGPASAKLIIAIAANKSDEEVLESITEVHRPEVKRTGVSGLQNLYNEGRRRMK